MALKTLSIVEAEQDLCDITAIYSSYWLPSAVEEGHGLHETGNKFGIALHEVRVYIGGTYVDITDKLSERQRERILTIIKNENV